MGTNTPMPNRSARIASLQKLIDGLTRHAGLIPSLTILGRSMTPQELVDVLNVSIAIAGDVGTTYDAWLAVVKADAEARKRGRPLVSGLIQTLLAAFTGQPDALADFGLSARRVAVRTREQLLVAAAKGRQTRFARAVHRGVIT